MSASTIHSNICMSSAGHIPAMEIDNLTICGRVKTWLAVKGY